MPQLKPVSRILYAGSCQAIAPQHRFAQAKAAGFDAVTLFTSDLVRARHDGVSNIALREMIEAHGLALASVEIVGNWLPGQRADTATLPRDMAENLLSGTAEKVCAHAVELGARSITVADLFGLPFDRAGVARCFSDVCKVAADHGLDVVLEFVPLGCVATLAEARAVLEDAGHANAGILIDSWHFFRGGSSLEELARLPAEMIAAWQMNDAPLAPVSDDVFTDMMIRLLPGDGDFNLAGLMQAIAATGTTAPGGIEVFSEQLNRLPFDDLAGRYARSMDYCLELAGKQS